MTSERLKHIFASLAWVMMFSIVGIFWYLDWQRYATIRQLTGDQFLVTMVDALASNRVLTDENGIIIAASDSAASVLGYSREELKDKPAEILMDAASRQKFKVAYARAIEDAKFGRDAPVSRHICYGIMKNGERRLLEITTRIRRSGRTVCGIATLYPADTVESKQVQEYR